MPDIFILPPSAKLNAAITIIKQIKASLPRGQQARLLEAVKLIEEAMEAYKSQGK